MKIWQSRVIIHERKCLIHLAENMNAGFEVGGVMSVVIRVPFKLQTVIQPLGYYMLH